MFHNYNLPVLLWLPGARKAMQNIQNSKLLKCFIAVLTKLRTGLWQVNASYQKIKTSFLMYYGVVLQLLFLRFSKIRNFLFNKSKTSFLENQSPEPVQQPKV